MTDLPRLSAGESEALLLIAEGHTAKSAARLLGVSENAVNERLRSARRKTGAGSSRELARRLKSIPNAARDSRHEEIGLEAASAPPAEGVPGAAGAGADLKNRREVMFLYATVAAIAAGLVALGVGRVSPGAVPRVIATTPVDGARVEAGPMTLSVTFDQPMRDAWSFTTVDAADFPCGRDAIRSADRRTFTLACVRRPHSRYRIGFNSFSFHGFAAARGGAPAAPTSIGFLTD